MTDIERRIRQMMAAEGAEPEKDAAGIYTARAVDAKIRRDIYQKCLDTFKKEPNAKTL